MVTVILDSDVVIDVLKERKRIVEWLGQIENAGERFALCAPVLGEVLRGAPPQGRSRVAPFLEAVEVIPFGVPEARRYGDLMEALDKAGRPIGNVDGQIAAIALEHGGRIATRNRKHFDRVAGLDVLSP